MTDLTDKFLQELKKKGIEPVGEPIVIVPTAADLRRQKEVNQYIANMEEAHRRTANSKLGPFRGYYSDN